MYLSAGQAESVSEGVRMPAGLAVHESPSPLTPHPTRVPCFQAFLGGSSGLRVLGDLALRKSSLTAS